VPSRVFAEVIRAYPKELVGFCVDTANSLRNFESPEDVMRLLGDRAFCYHLKDFAIQGHLLGFAVLGAPLGSGRLDVDGILDAVFASDPDPEILVENWVPSGGYREKDIEEDDSWLRLSLEHLRSKLALRRGAPAGVSA
jgi:3-oxoisoapionate decarboxylase